MASKTDPTITKEHLDETIYRLKVLLAALEFDQKKGDTKQVKAYAERGIFNSIDELGPVVTKINKIACDMLPVEMRPSKGRDSGYAGSCGSNVMETEPRWPIQESGNGTGESISEASEHEDNITD